MYIALYAVVISYLLMSLSLSILSFLTTFGHPTCYSFMKSPQKSSRTSRPPTLASYNLFRCSVLFRYSHLLLSLNSVILSGFYE